MLCRLSIRSLRLQAYWITKLCGIRLHLLLCNLLQRSSIFIRSIVLSRLLFEFSAPVEALRGLVGSYGIRGLCFQRDRVSQLTWVLFGAIFEALLLIISVSRACDFRNGCGTAGMLTVCKLKCVSAQSFCPRCHHNCTQIEPRSVRAKRHMLVMMSSTTTKRSAGS